VFGLLLGEATTAPLLLRLGLSALAVFLIAIVCFRAPAYGVLGLIAWLCVLGTVRRVLDPGGVGRYDPLLLVAPIALAVITAAATRAGAFRSRTPVSSSILLLSVLVVVSVLNPIQGGVAVGIGSLFFVLVPLLWFWVGRAILDDALFGRILRLLLFLAVASAGYGLLQVYLGFPGWDARWIATHQFDALRVGESVRPFASFASPSEYVGILAIGFMVAVLGMRRAARIIPGAAATVVLAWALGLASVRGAIVILPVALGMVFAVAKGFGFGRILLFGLASLLLVGAAASRLDPATVGGGRTAALLSRQLTGLSDPLNPDPGVSTLPAHIGLLVNGLKEAVRNPLGRGLGVVTLAGSKFGSETTSTEIDPSNMAVGLGMPGLLAYLAVVVLSFRLAMRQARSRRDLLSLAALGILLVTAFQWLNGGVYAVAPLPWLVIGWLDRAGDDVPDSQDSRVIGTRFAVRGLVGGTVAKSTPVNEIGHLAGERKGGDRSGTRDARDRHQHGEADHGDHRSDERRP